MQTIDSWQNIYIHKMHFSLSNHRYKSLLKIVLMAWNIGVSSFYFGYTVTYFSSVPIETHIDIYNIDMNRSIAQGFFNGCVPIGACVGALCSSFLIQIFSRRQCLLIVNLISIIAGFILFVKSPYSLAIGRIIQGLCVGLFSSLSTMIIKQLSPVQISGPLGAFGSFNSNLGNMSGFLTFFVFGLIFGDWTGQSFWVVMLSITIVTSLIQSAILLWIFPVQTPKYWLLKGRADKARQVIQFIYKHQYVEQVLAQKYQDIEYLRSINPQKQQQGLQYIHHSQQNTQELIAKAKPAFKSNKRSLMMAIHLAILLQFSGGHLVIVYAGSFIAKEKTSVFDRSVPSLIHALRALCTCFAVILLHLLGRKTILQFGCIVMCFANIVIGLGFLKEGVWGQMANQMIVLGLSVFMGVLGLTLAPVIWLYFPEIIAPKQMPFIVGTVWLFAALVTLLFPIIRDDILGGNPGTMFLFFGLWCCISFLINAKFMVETKGKTQKVIRQQYQRTKVNLIC